ncbi:hypothetical protein [Gracilibacillus salinarum]|uniref:Proteasome subunit beta n=1 Tax=Gracilibacillus salinarum TaxID=2932255 RepID=A0ABY4GQF7_9BACI|nr:hypothetical protein [Gracilibacillus salinarum]UOQ86195.1 hypothetical protein MUN87_04670 [Gracilibacillus salinarum]
MSLVIAIAMHDKVVISGDYKAVSFKDESKTLSGINKVFRFNDKVAFGLTGDLNVMIELNNYLSEQQSKKPKATVQAVAGMIRRYLRKALAANPDLQQRVIVAGIGNGNKITIIEMSHEDNYKGQTYAPKPSEAVWRVMYSNVSAEPFIAKAFGELSDYSSQRLISLLSGVNAEVASKDSYVSEGCEVIAISK